MDRELQRDFTVGSEWLYYKVYCGYKTSDVVLTQVIKPITEELLVKGLISKWFFIRYADPKNHLRIRLLCPNYEHLGLVIKSLFEPLNNLMAQDLIWKVQLDTYRRELERYGRNTMELSESLFYLDSIVITEFLDLIEGDEGEQIRWLFGLRSINQYLEVFEYCIDKKILLMEELKTGFGREFGMSRELKKQLDKKFRVERNRIERFMEFSKNSIPEYDPILDVLDYKKEHLQPIAFRILKCLQEQDDGLELKSDSLIKSYIHMFMNRLFRSKNRLCEMVCYDFLYRYYRSVAARKVNIV